MNSARPASVKVEVSAFEEIFKRHGLNIFALCSHPSFKEALAGAEVGDHLERFQDVIECVQSKTCVSLEIFCFKSLILGTAMGVHFMKSRCMDAKFM